jgi:signal transduction histidine kinase
MIAGELLGRIVETMKGLLLARGTGLGLAIVKKIIDEHNGAVSVENLSGRGASVSITLPLQRESAKAA